MRSLLFITHPEVQIDPGCPVPQWSLSATGRERMARLACALLDRSISAVWCSEERKAIEAAVLLGERLGLAVQRHAQLGENDRSSTGYVPKTRFEALADRFFAEPERSVEGWERAIDAQRRIVGAIEHVITHSPARGNIAVVAHGGVGTLLLCALKGVAISRIHDQPGQGHCFAFEFERDQRRLTHDWQRFE